MQTSEIRTKKRGKTCRDGGKERMMSVLVTEQRKNETGGRAKMGL